MCLIVLVSSKNLTFKLRGYTTIIIIYFHKMKLTTTSIAVLALLLGASSQSDNNNCFKCLAGASKRYCQKKTGGWYDDSADSVC